MSNSQSVNTRLKRLSVCLIDDNMTVLTYPTFLYGTSHRETYLHLLEYGLSVAT